MQVDDILGVANGLIIKVISHVLANHAIRFAGPDAVRVFLVKRITPLVPYKAWPIRNRYRKQSPTHLFRVRSADYPANRLYAIYLVSINSRLTIQDGTCLCTNRYLRGAL